MKHVKGGEEKSLRKLCSIVQFNKNAICSPHAVATHVATALPSKGPTKTPPKGLPQTQPSCTPHEPRHQTVHLKRTLDLFLSTRRSSTKVQLTLHAKRGEDYKEKGGALKVTFFELSLKLSDFPGHFLLTRNKEDNYMLAQVFFRLVQGELMKVPLTSYRECLLL